MSDGRYDKWMERLEKIPPGERGNVVAAKLRELADHLESGKYPIVYYAEWPDDLNASIECDFVVALSHPWPG